MSWTDERIDTLRTMWEAGQTASQIAEALGGVSRNAVIGKAHRLGLQARPSPVKANEPAAAPAAEPVVAAPPPPPPPPAPEPEPEPSPFVAEDEPDTEIEAEPAKPREPQPILRSVGPGGFVRQSPGEQQPPPSPAPPRRRVAEKPSAEMAGKKRRGEVNEDKQKRANGQVQMGACGSRRESLPAMQGQG
ncbi:GcrA family cell cycle regulator, partial [Sphingomonas sanguinis]|uniref:GcrA family cell cycle regulator n=1 Tax=Sphingomonas sanguinis TaxID=33051 RepID=UPI0009EA233A